MAPRNLTLTRVHLTKLATDLATDLATSLVPTDDTSPTMTTTTPHQERASVQVMLMGRSAHGMVQGPAPLVLALVLVVLVPTPPVLMEMRARVQLLVEREGVQMVT